LVKSKSEHPLFTWENDDSPDGHSDEYWEKAQRQSAGEDEAPASQQGDDELSNVSLAQPSAMTSK
jgi:hypothetical protein